MSLRVDGLTTLIQVFDMPRALHFYRDLLGFEVVQRSQPSDACGWALLRLGGASLMLNTAYDEGERPAEPDPARQRAHDDTILYFSCPDLDGAHAFLRSQGLDVPAPKTSHYGMRQIYFHDPDGYGLCFQWPEG